MQVVKTNGKVNGVHTKQQSNGENSGNVKQLHAQIAAVSKALADLEHSRDKELVQPLETRLAELKAKLHGARPIGQQADVLRQKRLTEAEAAKVEAEATIKVARVLQRGLGVAAVQRLFHRRS